MMKVVSDCNVFVSCISSRSPYHAVYTSLVAGKFELIIAYDILLEYEEIIQIKYGLATALSFMNLLAVLPNVHYVYPYYRWNLIYKDSNDNKYCDAAVSGIANHIVTEDKHFDVVKHIAYPALTIVTIKEFLKLLSDN